MLTRNLSLFVALLLISNTCLSDDTCQETLNACDAAYTSQKILIKDLTTQVGNLAQKNILQDHVIQDQRSELNDPLKDPVKVAAVTVAITIAVILLTGHLK